MALATILDCSPEIHQIIYNRLTRRNDRLALIATCRTLYSMFRVRFTCDALQRKFIKTKAVVGFAVQVHESIPMYRPVVLVGVRVEDNVEKEKPEEVRNEAAEEEENNKVEKNTPEDAETETQDSMQSRIVVSCYRPGFFPADDDSTKDGDITIHGDSAKVYTSKRKKGAEGEGRTLIEFVLTPEAQAGVMVMTGSMLRQYWGRHCRECRGSRSICPGCGGVSIRWGECFASCGYSMPCPSCVGYGWAMHYKDIMRQDDDEGLDDIWRQLDEIDSSWLVRKKSK